MIKNQLSNKGNTSSLDQVPVHFAYASSNSQRITLIQGDSRRSKEYENNIKKEPICYK
jgi:hypothetical protein